MAASHPFSFWPGRALVAGAAIYVATALPVLSSDFQFFDKHQVSHPSVMSAFTLTFGLLLCDLSEDERRYTDMMRRAHLDIARRELGKYAKDLKTNVTHRAEEAAQLAIKEGARDWACAEHRAMLLRAMDR